MEISKKVKIFKNFNFNTLQLSICGSRYLMHIILCIGREKLNHRRVKSPSVLLPPKKNPNYATEWSCFVTLFFIYVSYVHRKQQLLMFVITDYLSTTGSVVKHMLAIIRHCCWTYHKSTKRD
jgi:hypothetical protein